MDPIDKGGFGLARILVIEDDVEVRKVIRRILEKNGHQVIEAANGKDGISKYRQDPTDLIITDIIMPEKEGIETIGELRKDFPNVKIIAVSGGGRIKSGDYLVLAQKIGAMRTLAKPFEWDTFVGTINELLAEPEG